MRGEAVGRSGGRRPASRVIRFVRLGSALLLVALLATFWSIGSGVQAISQVALREHPGDKVPALMALVAADRPPVRDRNRAVWALGQLGDPRALPLLQRLLAAEQAGQGTGLSAYELGKAVALCRGGVNLGAWVWRHGVWAA